MARLEGLEEQEQERELAHSEDEGQPRRLPLDQVRIDDRVERHSQHQVDADRDDPALVLGQEGEDQGEDGRADEDRDARLDPS